MRSETVICHVEEEEPEMQSEEPDIPSETPMVQEPQAEKEPAFVVESQENALSGEIESQTSSLETGNKVKGESWMFSLRSM